MAEDALGAKSLEAGRSPSPYVRSGSSQPGRPDPTSLRAFNARWVRAKRWGGERTHRLRKSGCARGGALLLLPRLANTRTPRPAPVGYQRVPHWLCTRRRPAGTPSPPSTALRPHPGPARPVPLTAPPSRCQILPRSPRPPPQSRDQSLAQAV